MAEPEVPSAEEPGGDGSGGREGPSKPTGLFETIDRHIYGFEAAIVSGALLAMAFFYVFKILHRDLKARVTTIDRFLLQNFWGQEAVGEAPPELIESVTTVYTPIILGVLTYLLCVAALRTRWGTIAEAKRPKKSWGRWFGLALPLTAGLYFAVKLVVWIPPDILCGGLTLVTAVAAVRDSVQRQAWGVAFGSAVTGCLFVAFFVVFTPNDYTWNDKLATVLLMYVGFFGASMTTRDGKHIKVDAVRKLVPRTKLHLYNAIGGILTILFIVFLEFLAVEYTLVYLLDPSSTVEGMELPYFLVPLPIVIALATMGIRFVVETWRAISAYRRGELPEIAEPELH